MKKNLIPASGIVHWLGTGLSTGSGLKNVVQESKKSIVWNRNITFAEKLLVKLGLEDRVEIRQYTLENLKQSLKHCFAILSIICRELNTSRGFIFENTTNRTGYSPRYCFCHSTFFIIS